MPSVSELLERESSTVDLEPGDFERLLRRRDRKQRNRRLSAGALAIILALVSFAVLTRAFRTAERPATEPTPTPVDRGIFSEIGGWITFGTEDGIWAVDPTRPGTQVKLSTNRGTPLAWSSDGSKLLILSYGRAPNRLYVLNADGTETTLITDCSYYCAEGGSFSSDGSQVIYANDVPDDNPPGSIDNARASIYVVDTQGGTPRVLLTGGRRSFPRTGRSHISTLSGPTYSPDGTQIAYFDLQFVGPSQLRVMNTDGSGTRVLLHWRGYHVYNLAWSPDGERLAFGADAGTFVVGADGSGLTLAIPGGADPYWSPDGTRIAYRTETGALGVAAPDGTHVQEFGYWEPGPWNPLVQPEPEVAQVPAPSEGLTLTSTLYLVAALLALVVGAVFIRRRMVRNAGSAIAAKRP